MLLAPCHAAQLVAAATAALDTPTCAIVLAPKLRLEPIAIAMALVMDEPRATILVELVL